MDKSAKNSFSQKSGFCKKNHAKKLVKIWRKNLLIFDSKLFPTIMGKVLRESIAISYGLHHKKGKSYTFNHFKKAAHKTTIYRTMKTFDDNGNMDRKPGSGSPEKLSNRQKLMLK